MTYTHGKEQLHYETKSIRYNRELLCFASFNSIRTLRNNPSLTLCFFLFPMNSFFPLLCLCFYAWAVAFVKWSGNEGKWFGSFFPCLSQHSIINKFFHRIIKLFKFCILYTSILFGKHVLSIYFRWTTLVSICFRSIFYLLNVLYNSQNKIVM